MNSYERLIELKKKREEYVRVSQENNMWEGTKKILTDMYPDTAHFVYELLQNAEDMCATEVKFVLSNDKLLFLHNGKKRDFVYEDIDSITSIGNNTLKRDDLTSIGTFGVGFKAVYTYTSTPEIHSGEFDFRIRDMVIPDPIDVPKIAKLGETKFIFPFNHKTKKSQDAVAEIRTALLELDENSILFLNHIEKIIFKLPDGSVGGVQIKNVDNVLKIINKVDANIKDSYEAKAKTYWFKFSKDCKVNTSKGEATLPVSLAFRMNANTEGNKRTYTVDETLKGKVFIYFPAVKERSDLHFHIHAPFASTVARDSVRNCAENNKLFNELAKLAVLSVSYFKDRKCMDYHYYAALPNRRDFLYGDTKFKVIYDELIKVFKNPNNELIITEDGDYKKIDQVKQGSREIVKLITSDDLYSLYKKYWVPAIVPQTREETFLYEIGLTIYDRKTIADTLRYKPNMYAPIFQKNLTDNDWFTRFYEQLSGVQALHLYIEDLREIKMLKCNDGQLHAANEGLFLRSNYTPKQIKDPIYVELNNSASKNIIEAATAFLKRLDIRVMAQEIDIMADLETGSVDADDVVIKLLEVIEEYKATQRVEQFKESEFILAKRINGNDTLYRVKAKNCCWTEEVTLFYEDEYDVDYVIAQDYYKSLVNEEIKLFKEIFIKLGGKTAPEIKQCQVDAQHPEWKNLDTTNIRYSATNNDYTITGLNSIHRIPEERLYKESLVLWNVVVCDKNIRHHEAVFAANSNRPIVTVDSRLAYILKRVKWIPNKEGEFCRPCDITEDELYDGFEYNKDSIFLQNIGFGDESQAPDDITSILEKAGVSVSAADEEWFRQSDEVKSEILQLLRERRTANKKGLSLEEALREENKIQTEYEDDDDYGRDISIKNPSARVKKQQEDFEAGLKKRISVKPVLKYTFNNRTSIIEKQFVREQYKGRCQICKREPIRMHNGDIYFEAINIISTANLDRSLLNNVDAGWNTLCLCPNCAAEYRYCSKNLDRFEEQVDATNVQAGMNDYISLEIELKSQSTKIMFTPKHFIALKAAFNVYKEHGNID